MPMLAACALLMLPLAARASADAYERCLIDALKRAADGDTVSALRAQCAAAAPAAGTTPAASGTTPAASGTTP
ncbi:MAG TPA: hypothetical protein PKA20_28850, partial [Burkholderiaceae bacterium]|nr:hypothetical protein [Burkholderiaceae bacterium]